MKAGTSESRDVPFIAHPQPKATLTFKGGDVRDSARIHPMLSDNLARFVIDFGERPDTGEYEMTLENDFGETSLSVKVIVLGKCLY